MEKEENNNKKKSKVDNDDYNFKILYIITFEYYSNKFIVKGPFYSKLAAFYYGVEFVYNKNQPLVNSYNKNELDKLNEFIIQLPKNIDNLDFQIHSFKKLLTEVLKKPKSRPPSGVRFTITEIYDGKEDKSFSYSETSKNLNNLILNIKKDMEEGEKMKKE